MSIIFRALPEGSERPGEVLIVDYVHERFENATEIQLGRPDSMDDQVERELRELYAQPLLTTQAATSNCRFEPMLNWRGAQKEETVSGYKCKMLSMDGFVYRALQRHLKEGTATDSKALTNSSSTSSAPSSSSSTKEVAKEETSPREVSSNTKEALAPVDHSVGDDLTMSWDRYSRAQAAPTGKVPLLYKNEFVTGKERVFKGTVWVTPQFQRKATDFLPIFECMVLSNQPKRFEKLAEFVRMKLPDDQFPVRVELPVFPTISGQASFLIYEEKNPEDIDDLLFQVPESFTKASKVSQSAKSKKEKEKKK